MNSKLDIISSHSETSTYLQRMVQFTLKYRTRKHQEISQHFCDNRLL